jgi:hypothetical protein
MIDPLTGAAAAVALVVPYLVKMGEAAAEKAGDATAEGAGKLLGWMRSRLTGRGSEALADLERLPADPDNQADFRKQFSKALEADPALLQEFRTMLPDEAPLSRSMNQDVSGHGAKAAQVQGSGNRTTIS